MLCSVKSQQEDYSRVSLNLNIPWHTDYVKYYVSSINTKANILLTTEDDYLIFKTSSGDIRIDFKDCYSYSLNSLVKFLNSCQTEIQFKNVDNRTISLLSVNVAFLQNGSHRAKLITGLYNTKEFILEPNIESLVPDLPILDFANKLYLVSLQGQAVSSNLNDQEYTPSIIANLDTIILDNEALIVNYDQAKPIKIKCNTDSLKYLEMRLVDFMFQPIILKSPLFITIKIKPVEKQELI